MAFQEHTREPKDVWERMSNMLGIFDVPLCVSEQCVSERPECIERCQGEDEDSENFEDAILFRDEVILKPGIARVKTDPSAGEFKLRWATLEGMHETPGGDRGNGTMHHSILPLSNTGDEGESLRALPAPPFRTGLPMKAYLYQAIPSDAIDIELQKSLQSLSADALNVLALRRIQPGEYEIDGRQIHIYRSGTQYLVHEDAVGGVVGSGIADMPLRAYINLVANVALSLRRRGVSPTFIDTGSSTKLNAIRDDTDDRYRAMQIACTQAELRESSQYYSALT